MKSKQIELNNKAGIYLRLSKDDEKAGESLSIENQRLILQKYAVEHGCEIVDEYIDDGYSGTSFERPEVQRLLEGAKTGRINIIIVKDLSRFGRNYIQVGQFVDYIFPMYNIRFIALSDNVDTADRNSSGMDMMPIMNVFNEFHSANTSKKIRTVIEANAKEGKYRVTYAPYGYIKGNDEHKLPIPNEPAASNVKRIFEMRAQGISPQKIADTFNNEGILTPLDFRTEMLGKPKRKTRHLWTDAAIKQILRNPTYLGHLVQLRTTTVSYKNRKVIHRDESEMITIHNTHEPLISQELWDKVREVEASVSQGKRTKQGETMPLSGLMFCVDCGGKMCIGWNNTRHKRTDPRTYRRQNYKCGNYARFGSRVCDNSHYIAMKDINAVVLADIRSKAQLVIKNEKQAREEFLRHKEKISSTQRNSDKRKVKQIETRLIELDRLIQSTYEDKVLGKIPEQICVNLLSKYQEEKNKISPELIELKRKLDESIKDEADVEEFIKRIKQYIDVSELTREMCLELIECITIDKCPGRYVKTPREIHIYYKLIDKDAARKFQESKEIL